MILATREVKPSEWTDKYQAQLSDAILVEQDSIPEYLSLALAEAKTKLADLTDDEVQLVTINDDGTAIVEELE